MTVADWWLVTFPLAMGGVLVGLADWWARK